MKKNEIELGNRRYFVVQSKDFCWCEVTHAALSNGTVVEAKQVFDDYFDQNDQAWIELTMPNGYKDTLSLNNMEYYDILLLKEIEDKPFEFVGEVFSAGSAGSAYIEVPDKYLGKKFRLIEVI
jgi:hypothetical protein